MALSADDAARLAKLQTAYDLLISGQQIAEVDYNGRRTVFNKGDVVELKKQIDGLNALARAGTGRQRGAIRFRL